MEFPHLNDTKFPIIDNVNVYKYQNNFDYARWQGKVSYKLLNVKWNNTYADVPYFDTLELRDSWFDSQSGQVGILETVFNNTPKNTLKIPLPFNDMYHYNYIVIDMPVQTSLNNPINYGDENLRVARWFFFINDMQQFAPNTTQLEIEVDYWTTFIHSVDIPYLMLERGHAPMVQTTVEQFLANPIMNNEYLLADDFNYGNETIIQTSNYVPIGNDTKYVLFCAPYESTDFQYFDSEIYSGNSTPPSYSDTNERWGYQIQVNDYEWKYGDTNYNGANLPIKNQIQDGLLNGCKCYAIVGSQAKAFFNYCAKYCVHFIHGIKALFILDENLFTKGTSISFKGYNIYPVTKKSVDLNITLNKAVFGFDNKYANIAKLYTFPYSMLEVTDDEGNSFIAKIENCGNMKIHQEVSLIYPFLNYNVFISGVNGDGTMEYTWKNVSGDSNSKIMWASDFSKFMMNWNIPTYSLYVSAENEYAANNYFDVMAKRARAIKDYENAVRYANTNYENTDDSYTTNTANVNRTTTKDVTNVNRTQQGLVDNSQDLNDFRTDRWEIIYDGDAINGGSLVMDKYAEDITKMNNDAAADCDFVNDSTGLIVDYIAATSAINAGGSLLTGAVGGNNENIISGGIDALSTTFSAMALVSKDTSIANLNTGTINRKRDNAITFIDNYSPKQKSWHRSLKNKENTYTTKTVNRFSLVTPAMGASVGINNQNIADEKTCNDANALATQTTETNNADWIRDATVVAEKANLVQKQLEAENAYKNARLHIPHEQAAYSGDFMPDAYERRGIRLNIRTQPKSAIAQAGDAFLRFGYALHRVWDMSNGFHYCKNFTFWKAEDIWINDGTGVANVAVNAISNILLSGVTVWRDPTKIGTVGIYDNI